MEKDQEVILKVILISIVFGLVALFTLYRYSAKILSTLLNLIANSAGVKLNFTGFSVFPLYIASFSCTVPAKGKNPELSIKWKMLHITVNWQNLIPTLFYKESKKPDSCSAVIFLQLDGLQVFSPSLDFSVFLDPSEKKVKKAAKNAFRGVVSERVLSSLGLKNYLFCLIKRVGQSVGVFFGVKMVDFSFNFHFPAHHSKIFGSCSRMMVSFPIAGEPVFENICMKAAIEDGKLLIIHNGHETVNYKGTLAVMSMDIHIPTGKMEARAFFHGTKNFVTILIPTFLHFYQVYQNAEDDSIEIKLVHGLSTGGKMAMFLDCDAIKVTVIDPRCKDPLKIDIQNIHGMLKTFQITTDNELLYQNKLVSKDESKYLSYFDHFKRALKRTLTGGPTIGVNKEKLMTAEVGEVKFHCSNTDGIAYVKDASMRKVKRVNNENSFTDDDHMTMFCDKAIFQRVQKDLLDWLMVLQNTSDKLPSSRFSHQKNSSIDATVHRAVYSGQPFPFNFNPEPELQVQPSEENEFFELLKTHEMFRMDLVKPTPVDQNRLCCFDFENMIATKSLKCGEVFSTYGIHSRRFSVHTSLPTRDLEKQYQLTVGDKEGEIKTPKNEKMVNNVKNENFFERSEVDFCFYTGTRWVFNNFDVKVNVGATVTPLEFSTNIVLIEFADSLACKKQEPCSFSDYHAPVSAQFHPFLSLIHGTAIWTNENVGAELAEMKIDGSMAGNIKILCGVNIFLKTVGRILHRMKLAKSIGVELDGFFSDPRSSTGEGEGLAVELQKRRYINEVQLQRERFLASHPQLLRDSSSDSEEEKEEILDLDEKITAVRLTSLLIEISLETPKPLDIKDDSAKPSPTNSSGSKVKRGLFRTKKSFTATKKETEELFGRSMIIALSILEFKKTTNTLALMFEDCSVASSTFLGRPAFQARGFKFSKLGNQPFEPVNPQQSNSENVLSVDLLQVAMDHCEINMGHKMELGLLADALGSQLAAYKKASTGVEQVESDSESDDESSSSDDSSLSSDRNSDYSTSDSEGGHRSKTPEKEFLSHTKNHRASFFSGSVDHEDSKSVLTAGENTSVDGSTEVFDERMAELEEERVKKAPFVARVQLDLFTISLDMPNRGKLHESFMEIQYDDFYLELDSTKGIEEVQAEIAMLDVGDSVWHEIQEEQKRKQLSSSTHTSTSTSTELLTYSAITGGQLNFKIKTWKILFKPSPIPLVEYTSLSFTGPMYSASVEDPRVPVEYTVVQLSDSVPTSFLEVSSAITTPKPRSKSGGSFISPGDKEREKEKRERAMREKKGQSGGITTLPLFTVTTKSGAPGKIYMNLLMKGENMYIEVQPETKAWVSGVNLGLDFCLPPNKDPSPGMALWDTFRYWFHGNFQLRFDRVSVQMKGVDKTKRVLKLKIVFGNPLLLVDSGSVSFTSSDVLIESAFGVTARKLKNTQSSREDLTFARICTLPFLGLALTHRRISRDDAFDPRASAILNYTSSTHSEEKVHAYSHHDVYLRPAVVEKQINPAHRHTLNNGHFNTCNSNSVTPRNAAKLRYLENDKYHFFRCKKQSVNWEVEVRFKDHSEQPIAVNIRLDQMLRVVEGLSFIGSAHGDPLSEDPGLRVGFGDVEGNSEELVASPRLKGVLKAPNTIGASDLVRRLQVQLLMNNFILSSWKSHSNLEGIVYIQDQAEMQLRLIRMQQQQHMLTINSETSLPDKKDKKERRNSSKTPKKDKAPEKPTSSSLKTPDLPLKIDHFFMEILFAELYVRDWKMPKGGTKVAPDRVSNSGFRENSSTSVLSESSVDSHNLSKATSFAPVGAFGQMSSASSSSITSASHNSAKTSAFEPTSVLEVHDLCTSLNKMVHASNAVVSLTESGGVTNRCQLFKKGNLLRMQNEHNDLVLPGKLQQVIKDRNDQIQNVWRRKSFEYLLKFVKNSEDQFNIKSFSEKNYYRILVLISQDSTNETSKKPEKEQFKNFKKRLSVLDNKDQKPSEKSPKDRRMSVAAGKKRKSTFKGLNRDTLLRKFANQEIELKKWDPATHGYRASLRSFAANHSAFTPPQNALPASYVGARHTLGGAGFHQKNPNKYRDKWSPTNHANQTEFRTEESTFGDKKWGLKMVDIRILMTIKIRDTLFGYIGTIIETFGEKSDDTAVVVTIPEQSKEVRESVEDTLEGIKTSETEKNQKQLREKAKNVLVDSDSEDEKKEETKSKDLNKGLIGKDVRITGDLESESGSGKKTLKEDSEESSEESSAEEEEELGTLLHFIKNREIFDVKDNNNSGSFNQSNKSFQGLLSPKSRALSIKPEAQAQKQTLQNRHYRRGGRGINRSRATARANNANSVDFTSLLDLDEDEIEDSTLPFPREPSRLTEETRSSTDTGLLKSASSKTELNPKPDIPANFIYFIVELVDPQLNFLDTKTHGSLLIVAGRSSVEGTRSNSMMIPPKQKMGGSQIQIEQIIHEPKRRQQVRLRMDKVSAYTAHTNPTTDTLIEEDEVHWKQLESTTRSTLDLLRQPEKRSTIRRQEDLDEHEKSGIFTAIKDFQIRAQYIFWTAVDKELSHILPTIQTKDPIVGTFRLELPLLCVDIESWQFHVLISVMKNVLLVPPNSANKTQQKGAQDNGKWLEVTRDPEVLSKYDMKPDLHYPIDLTWKSGRDEVKVLIEESLNKMLLHQNNNKTNRFVEVFIGRCTWKMRAPSSVHTSATLHAELQQLQNNNFFNHIGALVQGVDSNIFSDKVNDQMEIEFTGIYATMTFFEDRSSTSLFEVQRLWMKDMDPGIDSATFAEKALIMMPRLETLKGLETCNRCGVTFKLEDNASNACTFHANEDGDPGLYQDTVLIDELTGKPTYVKKWNCCGRHHEFAPGCSARPHMCKEVMLSVRSEASTPVRIDNIDMSVLKSFEISFFPGVNYILQLQLTKSLSDVLHRYFSVDTIVNENNRNPIPNPIQNPDLPPKSQSTLTKLKVKTKGRLLKIRNSISSRGSNKSTSSDENRSVISETSTVVAVTHTNMDVVTENDNELDEDNENNAIVPTTSTALETSRQEGLYVRYMRVGDINVDVSTAGFPLNLDRFKAIMEPFFCRKEVLSWPKLISMFEMHLVWSLTKNTASSSLVRVKQLFTSKPSKPLGLKSSSGDSLEDEGVSPEIEIAKKRAILLGLPFYLSEDNSITATGSVSTDYGGGLSSPSPISGNAGNKTSGDGKKTKKRATFFS